MRINKHSLYSRQFILFFIIYLSPSFVSFAQVEDGPLDFEVFFKEDMTEVEGVLPVYQLGEKIYLEISQKWIGREIEIRAQVNHGLDMSSRPIQSLGVVRIMMGQKQTICFQREIFAERVLDEKSELHETFRASNKQPIDILYPIVAYAKNRNGYIIEITDILKNGDKWFQMNYNHVRALNSQYSKITGVHAFNEGVSFSVHQMYGYSPERENTAGAIVILPEGYMPVEVGCVIRLLPEQDMRLRLASDRVGFKTIRFKDFTQNPYGVVQDSLIMRWNLGISDKDMTSYCRGRLIEPKSPIIFYVDSHFPQAYIPAVNKAISAWNRAFEQAGYKNVIQLKIADKTIRLEEQKAVIAYDLIEPGVKSAFTVHPRTGEILSCRINIGHGFVPKELTSYLLQCGAVDARIIENRSHPEVVSDIMASFLMKSMGEILGLRPNYAGSAAYSFATIKNAKHIAEYGYTASIMDDNPYHYAASSKDRIAVKKLVPSVGEYDSWALGWAYKEFPKNKDPYADRESLATYLSTSNLSAHRYVSSSNSTHFGKGDLSSERVKTLNQGLENLLFIFENIDKIAYSGPIKDSGYAIRELAREAMSMYHYYLNLAVECFGRSHSLQQQKGAMEILSNYFFPGTLPVDIKIVRENQLADFREMIVRSGGGLFEKIFSKELMKELLQAEKSGADSYTASLFFKDLYRELFSNFDPQQPFSAQQMDIQVLGIGTWLKVAEENKIFDNHDMESGILANEMRYVYTQLRQLSKIHTDPSSRNICKILANKMAQSLSHLQ